MKLEYVRKIDSDGSHNAFTGLGRFDGRYYLAYRKARGHITQESAQIVLVSDDGGQWREMRGKVFPGVDYRDSYFMIHDDELRLYSCATPVENGVRGTSFTMLQTLKPGTSKFSDELIVERNSVIWKPSCFAGVFYGAAYSRSDDGFDLYLNVSDDGIHWRKAARIAAGSEAVFHSPEPERMLAFVRTEAPPYPFEIYESVKPFEQWNKIYETSRIMQCPHIQECDGKILLLGRERPDYMKTADPANPSFGTHRTKIWKYENNDLVELLELPSAGDCAYTGTALTPDGKGMFVTYYSQHERENADRWVDTTATDIYLAKVIF